MSGGNCPETPRQKMIGMMYLLLTAMLALNVSSTLLDAFAFIDKTILQSKNTIESKNSVLYYDFANAFDLNPAKVEHSWIEAQKIKEKADELVGHIQELKVLIVQAADAKSTPEDYERAISNKDAAGQIMITTEGGRRSKVLKEKIVEFRELLLEAVTDSALRASIMVGLSVEPIPNKNEPNATWESQKFSYIPLAASMALMSQLQTSVRNFESDVVNYIFAKIDESSFKFNKVDALVIQRSEYIIAGDEYYAEIMIAARDTNQAPTINVPGRNVVMDEARGVGVMKTPTSSPGPQKWSGELSIKSPDGTRDLFYPISGEYLVATPSLVISPVKMNVLYEGLENPVEVSVPGVASENLRVDITNATSVKQGNQFMVTPRAGTAGGTVKISVIAKMGSRDQNMGERLFRIKRVPEPVAEVNRQSEGKIRKEILLAQTGIVAEMKDFDFEMKWTVTSFRVSAVRGGFLVDEAATNNLFTQAQKDLIRSLGRGQQVVIDNIRASGPGGVSRGLGSIVLVID